MKYPTRGKINITTNHNVVDRNRRSFNLIVVMWLIKMISLVNGQDHFKQDLFGKNEGFVNILNGST